VKTSNDFGKNGDRPSHPEFARLAGDGTREERVEIEAVAPAYGHEQRLPAILPFANR